MTDLLLAIETPTATADVVELNPDRDVNDMTAVLAAKLVRELAALATAFPCPATPSRGPEFPSLQGGVRGGCG